MKSNVVFTDLTYPYEGYVAIEDDMIYASAIGVVPPMRNKGLFRKFIEDTKETYKTIKVPQPSTFLKEILARYGFVLTHEYFEQAKENIEVMVWSFGNED